MAKAPDAWASTWATSKKWGPAPSQYAGTNRSRAGFMWWPKNSRPLMVMNGSLKRESSQMAWS